jgi:hypothetical protein
MSSNMTWDEMRAYDQAFGYVPFERLYAGLVLHKDIDDNARDLSEEDNERTCTILSIKSVTWYCDWIDKDITQNEYRIRFHETNREVDVRAVHEQAWGWKIQSQPAS